MPSVQDLLRNAPRDREYFLRFLLGFSQSDLLLHHTDDVPVRTLTRLKALEKKRAAGWPVQYLLGEAWFYGRRFKVAPGVLIPRPETELMIDRARECAREHTSCSIVDVGTGSGAIAITMALETNKPVFALELSGPALRIAHTNARAHHARVTFVKSNLLAKFPWQKNTLIVCANLPYLSERRMKKLERDVMREPRLALYGGSDGLNLYRSLLADLKAKQHPGQHIIVLAEIDPEQKTKLARFVSREFPNAVCRFHHDLHGDVRLAEIAW